MSGTRTVEIPRGLDTLSKDDLALMDAMREEAPAPEGMEPAPEPEQSEPTIELEASEAPAAEPSIEIPADEPEEDPQPARRHTASERIKILTDQRKAAEKRAAEAEEKRLASEAALATEKAVTQERLNILAELARQQQPPVTAAPVPTVEEEPLPDVNTDPIGHFQEALRRVTAARENDRAIMRGFQENQQSLQRQAEFRDWGRGQELEFMAKEPSYTEAMNFLKVSRHAELEAIGIIDRNERERIIGQDVNAIAVKGRQDGVNFAERLYKTAMARGFAKVAPAREVAAEVIPAKPVIPPMDAAPARAARIEQGLDNATTIGSLGAAPPARMSVERLTAMSEGEFNAFKDKFLAKGGDIREILGY